MFHRGEFRIHANAMVGSQARVEKGRHSTHGYLHIYFSYKFSRDVAIKQYYDGYCDKEAALLMQASEVCKKLLITECRIPITKILFNVLEFW